MAANLAGKPMRDDDVATSSRANRDFSWNHRRLPDHCIQLAVSSSVGRGLNGGYIEHVWETNYDSQTGRIGRMKSP